MAERLKIQQKQNAKLEIQEWKMHSEKCKSRLQGGKQRNGICGNMSGCAGQLIGGL